MDKQISELKKIVTNSKQLIAFTVAGLSTESGIPTYRGAGGLWTKYDPAIYADINYFLQDSSYYWNFFREVRHPIIKKAKPNAAHYALVELEKQGKLRQVITQNIDGLHQMAGQSNVIELHGNTRKILCMECDKVFSMDKVYRRLEKEFPPKCTCGGRLKPNVVFFGEALPEKVLIEADYAAQNCDIFLVVGSSLVVYPAASIPKIAKRNGAILVIINVDSTPLDDIADLVIHESASKVLSRMFEWEKCKEKF
jgi:NAD-dependent deacetylase